MRSGETVAGPDVRAACDRHLEDLEHAHERGYRFDVQVVSRATDFFREVLRLNGGDFEGRPFELEPWQAFCVGSLMGWVNEETGARRFRTGYLEIGKGNGKSPLAAGIGMYCLVADNEPRAEVYAAATKKDQAQILFRDAVAMCDQSPELRKRLTKSGRDDRCWNLAYARTGSFFRTISSESGQSGPRPHCSLCDELHEHPNALVVDMLKLGQKGRRQALAIEITNSGFDRTSVCYEHHVYSQTAVRAKPGGKGFDDTWFAYVCGLDKDDDPFEDSAEGRACWVKANPNLGVSIQPSYIEDAVRAGRGMPSMRSTIQRLTFCQWVDAESPWIEGDLWEASERHEMDALELMARCPEVVGALDLSGTRDLTALALEGLLGDEVIARVEFWTPAETAVERSARDRVPYDAWIEKKHVHGTPGRAIDYAFVAQRLVDLQTLLPNFRRLAFDPYRIKYLEVELDRIGAEFELIPHAQGYYKAGAKKDEDGEELPQLWMPHSIELLERAVIDGTLAVEWNPCLHWNSASAVLEADPKNNRIFTKRKSRGRIDGIVALAMCTGLLLEHEAPTTEPSVRWLD